MSTERTIEQVKELLPNSEVFPLHIREMLLRELNGLTGAQLDLLYAILSEEKERLSI